MMCVLLSIQLPHGTHLPVHTARKGALIFALLLPGMHGTVARLLTYVISP
jgi:hypothetical protein